jgi:hypothetical protein
VVHSTPELTEIPKMQRKFRSMPFLALMCFFWFPGLALAGYDEGVAAYKTKDFATALREWKPLAEQGNVDAQYALGVMSDNGQGVPQSYKEALKWIRLAADQGNATAQYNLGSKYANGQGVPQDYKEAVKWYRLAADQGNADAQNNLGVGYVNGQGVPESKVIGYALYNLAASNDASADQKAKDNRTNLAGSMSAKEIEVAQDLTRELIKPGNFLKALDKYAKNPTIKQKKIVVASNDGADDAPTAIDEFPARPAKVPGVVSCNTRCVNAMCLRTYDNGKKVRFRAKRVFDSFSGEWKFDSGNC